MAGTKRAAADSGVNTRANKVAKTGKGAAPKTAAAKRGGKRGPKTSISPSAFKSKALPLHVNITHTPPPLTEGGDDKVPATAADPGFIGSSTLVPSVFSTGSYGWKGNLRVGIEVTNEKGEKEKVQVMISMNATVMGSKQAGEGGDADEDAGEEKKADAETSDAAEEKASSDSE